MNKKSAIANILILAWPVILGISSAIIFNIGLKAKPFSVLTLMGLILLVIGSILIIISKWSNFKKGLITQFGISDKTQKSKYLSGYFLLLIGLVSIYLSRYNF